MKIIKKQLLTYSLIAINFIFPLFFSISENINTNEINNFTKSLNQNIESSAFTNPSGFADFDFENENGYDYTIRSYYEGANVIEDQTPNTITPPEDYIQTYNVPLSTGSYGLWPASMAYQDLATTKDGQLYTYNPIVEGQPKRDIAIGPVWNYPSIFQYRNIDTIWSRLNAGDMTGTYNWQVNLPNIAIPYYEPSIDYMWNIDLFNPEFEFSPRRSEYQQALISYNDDRFITFFAEGRENNVWEGIEIEFSYNLADLDYLREDMHFYVWMRALKREEDVTWGWLFGNDIFDIPIRYKIIEYTDLDGYSRTNNQYRYLTIPKGRILNEDNIPPEQRTDYNDNPIDQLSYMSEWQQIDLAPLIPDINLIGQHNIRIQLEMNTFSTTPIQKNMIFDINGIQWDLQFIDGFNSESSWYIKYDDLNPDSSILDENLILPEWQFESVDININAQAGSGLGASDYLRYGQFYVYDNNKAYVPITTGTYTYTEFNQYIYNFDDWGYQKIFIKFKGYGGAPEFLTESSATIHIQDISFTFHWHIQYKVESSYNYDPDHSDKILWRIDFDIANQGVYSPSSTEIYLPPNYELLELRKVSDNSLVTTDYTYDEPTEYWWDTIQRKIEINLDESLYGWFESDNIISYNTNYALIDQIQYTSDYYMDNMPVTIEFVFDARYLTLDDIYEYSLDYFGDGGTEGLTDEEILEIIENNGVAWGEDVFDWWDEWYLTGYSWDYFESSPYALVDYNTFFDSDFVYEASIGEIDVSNKVNQFKESITLITTPTINAQFYEEEGYSELLFKDSTQPRQIGYSNVESLFKMDYFDFQFDQDYTFNATHFNITGNYIGSSLENRDQTIVLSLFDSNLDYTGASFTYFIDDYISTNLKVDDLISTYGLSMKPTSITLPIKIDFTNEDIAQKKVWIRIALEPSQGDESHDYYAGQIFQLVTISGSSSKQEIFNINTRDGTMPKLYGAYNFVIQQYQYIDDNTYGNLENTIENQTKYFIVSDTAGEVLEQYSWSETGDQDYHDFLVEILKSGNEDATKLIASMIDSERICLEKEISIQYPASNAPYIERLYRPATSEIITIGALELSAKITDRNDDIDDCKWRLSFWLNIRYKGDDNLDPDNDQLFETDWETAEELEPDIWGVEWDVTIYEDQVEEQFYQIIPTSTQFWIEFDVNDTLLNNDYKCYKFSSNPYVELDAVSGNFDLNQFELPNMWVFRTFANYTYTSANVEVNEQLSGSLNIHSSILYTPTRFIVDLGEEWDDAHNYQVPFRYNYKGTYSNRTEASYAQYQSEMLDGSVSKWDFDEYFNIIVSSFTYSTPSMTTLSYRTLKDELQRTQYEYIIQVSSKHDFQNISAQLEAFFGTQSYLVELYIRVSGNYQLVDESYELTYTQSILGEINWIIPEMNSGDVYLFKAVITLFTSEGGSIEHYIYGITAAIIGVMAWLVFTSIIPRDTGMGSGLRNKWLSEGRDKATLYYILATIGVGIGAFALISTIFFFIL